VADDHRPRINPRIARITCSRSGRGFDSRGFARPIGLCGCCPAPGKPLVVEYDLEAVELGPFDRSKGIWSYGELLPVLDPGPSFASDVGGTATVEIARWSRDLEITVLVKNEGNSPSGSFKDRGLAAGVAFGVACGASRETSPTVV